MIDVKTIENKIINADCMDILKELPDKCVDLVLTDPPYLIKNTKAGGKSNFSKSIQQMNDEIKEAGITEGVSLDFCKEIIRIQDKINAYIWCNKAQIIDYLDFFVKENDCSYDILCWQKDNAMPTYNNKYLTDKEYCLYFRRGGYCQPQRYEDALTIFHEPINIKDKQMYKHPTIKPIGIFQTLINNSSKENDLVLDCFSGSGTTAIACHNLKRRFICIEKDKDYYEASVKRLEDAQKQLTLF
jgi:site-specific DNA-methyltransferase (adenine-specific)